MSYWYAKIGSLKAPRSVSALPTTMQQGDAATFVDIWQRYKGKVTADQIKAGLIDDMSIFWITARDLKPFSSARIVPNTSQEAIKKLVERGPLGGGGIVRATPLSGESLGHAFSVERTPNGIRYIDIQSGEQMLKKDLDQWFDPRRNIRFYHLM